MLRCALAILCGGCVPTPLLIGEGIPKPEVRLHGSPHSLALEIAPDVPDRFFVPSAAHHSPAWFGCDVRRWRATLETGYRQGLQPLFREAGTRPELVLQIWDADLDLVSTAWEMLPEQTCSGRDCIYARARLCFKARLLDANRQVLRHVARCASSPYRFREDDAEATKSAVGAVEVMYQQLAEALLADAALGAVPAPVQTAAQSRSHEQQPGPVLEW